MGSRSKATRQRQVVKIVHNNSSTERFAVNANAQKHFTTFLGGGGQVPPLAHLPMPAGAHAVSALVL